MGERKEGGKERVERRSEEEKGEEKKRKDIKGG